MRLAWKFARLDFLMENVAAMSRGGASNRSSFERGRALNMSSVRVFTSLGSAGPVRDAFDGGHVLDEQVKPLSQ